MAKLIIVGLILIMAMMLIWVIWGEAIVARVARQRRADDEGLWRR